MKAQDVADRLRSKYGWMEARNKVDRRIDLYSQKVSPCEGLYHPSASGRIRFWLDVHEGIPFEP